MLGIRQRMRRLVARLPRRWHQSLRRRYYASQIRGRSFRTPEPEFARLREMASPGDWVIDIGANVGHYALRLSELVGKAGRVIALEPVPDTFELLVANARVAQSDNITLLNAAASDSASMTGFTVPLDDDGLENFYLAQLSGNRTGLQVLCITVDSLNLPHPIRLVKIDTEGHELAVLRGMRGLLGRDHPVLIVEENDPEVLAYLAGFGYTSEKIPGSSNRIYRVPRSSRPEGP